METPILSDMINTKNQGSGRYTVLYTQGSLENTGDRNNLIRFISIYVDSDPPPPLPAISTVDGREWEEEEFGILCTSIIAEEVDSAKLI